MALWAPSSVASALKTPTWRLKQICAGALPSLCGCTGRVVDGNTHMDMGIGEYMSRAYPQCKQAFNLRYAWETLFQGLDQQGFARATIREPGALDLSEGLRARSKTSLIAA